MNITLNALKDRLASVRGAKIITFTALTKPSGMRKTGNPYATCMKESRVNGIINWSYEKAVNNQRLRESQPMDDFGNVEAFHAAPRQWGQRVRGTPFVEHNGTFYLEVKVQNALGHRYLFEEQVIEAEHIKPFLPNRDNEGIRQEVDNIIILRDYKLESIKQVILDQEVLTVV